MTRLGSGGRPSGQLRVAFPLSVVDVGFCLEEDEELLYDQVRFRRNAVTRLAVQAADLVVAVARADPVGLYGFIRGYQELRDLGVPASRVRVVVNQLRPGMFGGDRPADQVRAALSRYVGIEPAAVVPPTTAWRRRRPAGRPGAPRSPPRLPAQQALARLPRTCSPPTPSDPAAPGAAPAQPATPSPQPGRGHERKPPRRRRNWVGS